MDWTQIIIAVLLGAMLFRLFPQAKHMAKNSPKGSVQDWIGFIIPIIAVVLFVILLVNLV